MVGFACTWLTAASSLLAAAGAWEVAVGEFARVVVDAPFSQGSFACGGGRRHVRRTTRQLQAHIRMYMMQTQDQCPASLADLVDAGITTRLRRDPWGGSYHFTCNVASREVEVCSAGPDGAWGSDDDICAEKAGP